MLGLTGQFFEYRAVLGHWLTVDLAGLKIQGVLRQLLPRFDQEFGRFDWL